MLIDLASLEVSYLVFSRWWKTSVRCYCWTWFPTPLLNEEGKGGKTQPVSLFHKHARRWNGNIRQGTYEGPLNFLTLTWSILQRSFISPDIDERGHTLSFECISVGIVGKLLASVKALLLINWKLSHTEFISCTHSHLFIFFSVIDWSWIVKVEDQTERKNVTVNNNIRGHRMPAMLIHASLLQLKLRKTWKEDKDDMSSFIAGSKEISYSGL